MDINFEKSKYKIILGSASPRRRMYFDLLKIPYKVMIPNVDEIYPTELKESEISNYLAKIKSKNLKSKLKKNEILVTADTIVWFNNKHIGKPKAVRTVATAIGKNPLCWLIPCHRVLRANGELGGYHWGLNVKKNMLTYETQKNKI